MANVQSLRDVPEELTLNQRLNKSGLELLDSLDRFEAILSRVNGVPTSDAQAQTSAPIQQFSMAEMVTRIEELCSRAYRLVETAARIA